MNCWICKKKIWFWNREFGKGLHLVCFTKEFFAGHIKWTRLGIDWNRGDDKKE